MSKKLKEINKLLREQVSEMEKLLKLKEDRIKELEAKSVEQVLKHISQPIPSIVTIPSIWQVPCQHEYDSPPYQVGDFPNPPRCKKCGQPPFQQVIVTSGFIQQSQNDEYFLTNTKTGVTEKLDPLKIPRC